MGGEYPEGEWWMNRDFPTPPTIAGRTRKQSTERKFGKKK